MCACVFGLKALNQNKGSLISFLPNIPDELLFVLFPKFAYVKKNKKKKTKMQRFVNSRSVIALIKSSAALLYPENQQIGEREATLAS